MAAIPKHEPNKKTKGRKKTSPLTLADAQPVDSAAFVDVTPVADAIEYFARIFSTYVTQARDGDNGHSLYSDSRGLPVKVCLSTFDGEDEALHSVELELGGPVAHSIADSLKPRKTRT